MAKEKPTVTPATRALKAAGIQFEEHPYKYEDRGGTAVCARELGVDEHVVIKTLVMQDDTGKPMIILMHGDMDVSLKELARKLGCKSVSPSAPKDAERYTGYQVGGTSPFGVRRPMPVYMERTILDLPRIYINGGRRGFLVSMIPAYAASLLEAIPVLVGNPKS